MQRICCSINTRHSEHFYLLMLRPKSLLHMLLLLHLQLLSALCFEAWPSCERRRRAHGPIEVAGGSGGGGSCSEMKAVRRRPAASHGELILIILQAKNTFRATIKLYARALVRRTANGMKPMPLLAASSDAISKCECGGGGGGGAKLI